MKTFMLSCFAVCAFAAFAGMPTPLLVPDYNRDGKIDPTDRDKALAGEKFTIWLNDDDDDDGTDSGAEAGDTNNDLHDVPGGDGNDKDFADDHVNGRCDLLDFFPVLIDVNGVESPGDYTWKLISKSVNVVFTQLQTGNAGDFHTKEAKALDGETPLYRAEVTNLTEGVALPNGFLVNGRGVFLIEGAALADGGITLRGEKDGSDPVEVTLDLRVVDVEKMYGWLNLRPKEKEVKDEGEGEQWKVENSTVHLNSSPSPDSPSPDRRHFILVHGYNTNHEEARGNAAEFYKKLWQSGSDAMMTAVEWRGDQSQIKFGEIIPGLPTFTPNYHVNVENAFLAARPFADACKKLPGEKILVAHSLGNMLIASAITDYGLDYTKYVMLNAAVPCEAYDASAYDEDMVDDDWLGEEVKSEGEGEGEGGKSLTNHLDRASRWYRNFAGKEYDPYEYRRKLAWRGRFANLPRTVNYYSPTDNILLNPDPNEPDPDKLFKRDDPNICRKVEELLVAKLVNGRSIGRGGSKKTGFGFWSFSEKMKGTWLLDTVNDVLTNMLGVAQADAYKREGGWGENFEYDDDPEKPFDPANTRFTPFLDERMKTRGMLDILPAETERVRAQHLADAIPAESFAAGANDVATIENVNEEDFIGDNPDWPLYEGEEEHTNLWNHSAFREVAFYHTSKFYTSLAAVGKPRVIIDTDLGSSMDDLFTIDLAARMHKAGKLDLMAVMMDRPDGCDSEGKGEFLTFADRYLASLGLGDLPLGKSMPLAVEHIPQHVFNPYWTLIYSNNLSGVGLLLPTNRTPEEIRSLTNAITLYRRLLNDAPDKSVVICSTGFLTNLKGLMESGEDEGGDGIYSTGLELVAAKVKELRIMGGCFDSNSAPDGTGGAEYNVVGDPVAAKKVFEQWPSPIVVSPWEVGLKLYYKSDDVLADFPAGTFDPVIRAAYTYWPDPGPDAMNRLWDPMTLFPLTEGETLVPLSEKGGISVDEATGVTTFVLDPSSNRCYQVASNMNATAVMNRFREICRTGNPSLPDAVRCIKDAGVDYNGHDLTFKVPKFSLGAYGPDDVKLAFAVGDKTYAPDEVTYDPILEVFSVHFAVPEEDVTAGNVYSGVLTITLDNEKLGPNVVKTVPTQLVQGRQEQAEPMTDWFNETNLETPTNYVPATAMPERCLATVETTVLFTGQTFTVEYQSPSNAAQGAVRIVEDGRGGYKFQYYACVGKTNEDFFVRGWWDFNVGGEDVSEVKPVLNKEYTVRAEAYYFEDTRGEENTLVIWVEEVSSNRGSVKQFIGNIVNANGGVGGTTRLNSVGFAGEGAVSPLIGNFYTNVVNANLARVDGVEYATVSQAVVAANGRQVRLLHAASWKPTESDLGKSVKFLNKSCLVLDLSGLPANAQAVWTDVDGNDGTLTVKLVYADTVVYGTIRTAEGTDYVEGAIAVKDGKYVYVGDETGAAAFVADGVTKVVDHRGKGMVMPGCTDGHSHYLNTFAMNNMKGGILFDLGDNKAAVMQKLETAALAAQKAGKKSLCGFGWNSQIILTNKLSLTELDTVTHGVSTVIYDSSGHHAFCNSECLKRCKILSEDGKTVLIKEIDGGLLELKDDYPTGYTNERVTGYLTRMGGIDPDELIDDKVAEVAIRKSQELLLSTGYTSAMDAWSNNLHPSNLYVVANRMDASRDLKFALSMTYEVEPWQTNMTEEIDRLASLKETYGTERVRPEYLKVFMDGVVEARTGATIKPYTNNVFYKSFWSTNRLSEITRECNAKGLTVHTHTMGDAAIRDVTDAYIQGGDGTHRNCLVHLRNVRKEDFQRMAENNIACAAGPTWHTMDTEFAGMLRQFLCDEYVDHAYPIKSFFDAGIRVSSHSDYPANKPSPQDPFGMMHVAVNGMVPDPGELDYPFDTDELVTVAQAFQALTLNGAWQLGLENERGSIAVGKWADFVLADQDVFTCAKTEIGKTKVVSTWFEGEKVYQAPAKVLLPAGVQGYSYVVSNLTAGAEAEIAPTETTPGGATYELPIGAKVAIYAVPDEGYVISGANPYVIDAVTAETTLEDVALPMAVKPVVADTVVYGTIRTAEKGNSVAATIAIKNGKYVYVGDETGVEAFIEDGVTKVVDHRGKGMVMPGCTDGHSHYAMKFGLANMKGGVMFAPEDDKAAVLQKLKAAAEAAKAAGKKSLFGFGWNFVTLVAGEDAPPTLAELDEATNEEGEGEKVSMVILDSGGHHAFCNSECLLRCGIIDGEGGVLKPKIEGGYLDLDESGYPTGYAEERAMGYLMRMGGIDYDELMDDEVAEISIRKTRDLLLSTGYTAALEGWSNILHSNKLYAAAKRLDENGELNLVFPMTYEVEPWMSDAEMTNQIDYLDALNKTYGTRHILPEYLKIFMDGVVETRTGAMLKPYKPDVEHPDGFYYKSFWSTNRLADITATCNAKDLTVHVHTMGDAAIRDTVTAYIKGGDGKHRNCLVHLRNVSTNEVNDFERIAANNIACSAGFTWHVRGKEEELMELFLEKDYIEHAYPIKSFFDAGAKVSSHSDYPANEPCPQDPFGLMEVALTGQRPDLPEDEKLAPYDTDELVSLEQVFEALTINGAWQLGLENERGSIAVGKWADFVLADQDVFKCEMTDIGKTKVVSTWFEGEMVYPIRGSEENPWQIGATNAADVVAWTNASGRLVIDGKGAMKDFDPSAPWAGAAVAECLVASDVTAIGAKAFAGCTGLKTLVLHGQTPPTLGADNDLAGMRIFVAAGAADAYRAAWPAFAGQIDEMRSVKGEKIATHLYEMTYKWWDAARANDIGEGLAAYMEVLEWVDLIRRHLFPGQLLDWYEGLANRALCTSCRNGNFVGRNFDWGYDDVDECVMHVPAAEGRLESVGVASWFFPQELQDAFGVDEFLPELTMDGVNEKGVAINVNVVPGGDNGWTTGTNSNATRRLCAGFAVRTVLDNATNAAHAVEILRSRDIYSLKPLEFHWMISDAAESYIVECVSNALVVLKAKDARPKMANYYVSHSPSVGEYEVLTNAELTASVHTPHAMGIERYANVSNGLEQVNSVEAMFTHMTNVWYKLKYLPGNERKYWSDLNGAPIPGKPDERFTAFDNTAELNEARSNAFTQIQANYVAVTNYEAQTGSRTIDHSKEEWKWLTNGVVHTVHTSIYDLEKRELVVCVQEDAGTIRLRYQDEPYAPVPVMPGSPVTYDSEAMAAKAAGRSAFTPSVEVETKLGRGSDELKAYCGMFGCAVVPTSDGRWAVEATLYPEDWTNVVESAQEATRQIPLADIAALEVDDDPIPVTLTNCVPGFFYSLCDGAAVTNIRADMVEKDLNVLCGAGREVLFPEVTKPIGGQKSGFFTIGVKETSGVKPGSEGRPLPVVPKPGPYPYVN